MGRTVHDPRDPWSKLFLTFLAGLAEAEGGGSVCAPRRRWPGRAFDGSSRDGSRASRRSGMP
jgi:hypothetical protein